MKKQRQTPSSHFKEALRAVKKSEAILKSKSHLLDRLQETGSRLADDLCRELQLHDFAPAQRVAERYGPVDVTKSKERCTLNAP